MSSNIDRLESFFSSTKGVNITAYGEATKMCMDNVTGDIYINGQKVLPNGKANVIIIEIKDDIKGDVISKHGQLNIGTVYGNVLTNSGIINIGTLHGNAAADSGIIQIQNQIINPDNKDKNNATTVPNKKRLAIEMEPSSSSSSSPSSSSSSSSSVKVEEIDDKDNKKDNEKYSKKRKLIKPSERMFSTSRAKKS